MRKVCISRVSLVGIWRRGRGMGGWGGGEFITITVESPDPYIHCQNVGTQSHRNFVSICFRALAENKYVSLAKVKIPMVITP
jgi:hypothetical protein